MKMQRVGRHIVAGLVWGAALAAFAQSGGETDVRQALRVAVGKAGESLAAAGLPADQGISIWMPQAGQWEQVIQGELRTAVTRAGLRYVERTAEPFFDEVMRSLEQTVRKGDLLDASTKLDFGKLQNTRLLLYGVVRAAEAGPERVYAELELHLTELETMRHLWGGTFIERAYLGDRVQGRPEIDAALRTALASALAPLPEALKDAPKLSGVRKALKLPLAGDLDGYVEGLVDASFSALAISPVRAGVATVAEARALLLDKPDLADALLTGSVRDLSREEIARDFRRITYRDRAEVHLAIETRDGGEILWSHVATGIEEWTWEKPWPELLSEYRREIGIAAAVLLGLIVLGMLRRSWKDATERVR